MLLIIILFINYIQTVDETSNYSAVIVFYCLHCFVNTSGYVLVAVLSLRFGSFFILAGSSSQYVMVTSFHVPTVTKYN